MTEDKFEINLPQRHSILKVIEKLREDRLYGDLNLIHDYHSYRIMKSLCKKADVKYFHSHALGHFGASFLDQANVPMGSIQHILGHENRTTTEIYLHSIGDAERDAMDVLNSQFANDFQTKSHTKSHTNKKGFRA